MPGLLAALALVAVAPLARDGMAGHGGQVQLSAVPVGPYAVSAWTPPGTPTVGPCEITVAVMHPETRAPAADATVRLTVEPIGHAGPVVSAEAIRARDPLGIRYRADVSLPSPGRWQVRVDVQGPAGGGLASFELAVARPSRVPWLLGAAGVGALALLVLAKARRRSASRPPLGPRRPPGAVRDVAGGAHG